MMNASKIKKSKKIVEQYKMKAELDLAKTTYEDHMFSQMITDIATQFKMDVP